MTDYDHVGVIFDFDIIILLDGENEITFTDFDIGKAPQYTKEQVNQMKPRYKALMNLMTYLNDDTAV